MDQDPAASSAVAAATAELNIFSLSWLPDSWSFDIQVGAPVAVIIVLAVVVLLGCVDKRDSQIAA